MTENPQPQSAKNSELSISEDVKSLLSELPEPVRAFIASSERDRLVSTLKEKFGLTETEGAVFERDFIFMLLGVLGPIEFRASLVETGVSGEIVDALLVDIHKQVFSRFEQPVTEGPDKKNLPPNKEEVPGTSASTTPPPTPNTTPLVKEYVADPYREPPE